MAYERTFVIKNTSVPSANVVGTESVLSVVAA